MFWRKNWHWLLALIVVIGVGGFILFKPKTPATVKKVYKVPDFSQVRKDTTNKGDETRAEQTVAENTETPVEKSADPVDDTPETPLESLGEKVSLEDVENTTTPKADTDDWRTGDYGESLFGYGPYPKIPSDFPERYRPIWTHGVINLAGLPDEIQEHKRVEELMYRVRIKLWKQGRTDITSISLHPTTNKVYPLTANSVVVGYEGTGSAKRVYYVSADLNFPADLLGRIKVGEKPPGIQIIDKDSGGFNVYEFLGL